MHYNTIWKACDIEPLNISDTDTYQMSIKLVFLFYILWQYFLHLNFIAILLDIMKVVYPSAFNRNKHNLSMLDIIFIKSLWKHILYDHYF